MTATNGVTNGVHDSTKPDVVIVGGSLGGLFAGVALKSHGYNTIILERTPRFLLENQGAGIVAGGDTIEFFKRYDRTGKPVAVPSFKRLYLNQKGDVIHEEVNRQNMTSWDLSYYLLRANYDRVDSAYLEGGKLPEERPTDGQINYRYGCTVTDVIDEGAVVRVKFTKQEEDGTKVDDELTTKFLIAADGPSSTIRKMLCPEVERKYAGYVVIRGTVPEKEATQEALDVFRERFCFYHCPGIQNLTYTIAGENGTTEPGKRLLNFVWYTNFPEGEPEIEKLMTDKDGKRRHITIPPGMIAWDAWEMIKGRADEKLPPQMAEMAHKSKNPFVQCITDVISPKPLHMGDKVCLIGDALAGFRPHTVASTSQAAYDVMSLVDWLDGKIDRRQIVAQVMQYARLIQSRGVYIGNRSQFESLPVEEYIKDRNMMSKPRWELEYPEWTKADLDKM
ncbi:2,6-dihydroxypyridine 3-monooxygenase [Pseudocercospora fuligena]|uniref:2,6-dihydroxypyridine 3-monooxygenase n=1 Tax=Pseudocercospora fuligena TaxID=685502 RepID=A0A8H6RQF1_9PEZI|nr:2,6-dihydroxypyridine 3-monooxygenase [Pseudocercospora fuligena]